MYGYNTKKKKAKIKVKETDLSLSQNWLFPASGRKLEMLVRRVVTSL